LAPPFHDHPRLVQRIKEFAVEQFIPQFCSVIPNFRLTSREFLYHLPCSSSARKLDSFGSGWLAPETAVRTERVVVSSPAFDDDLGFFQRVEQFPVEKLIAQLCSVMPSFRQESSTARPLPVSSSTVRRCLIISSDVYRFLGMTLTSLVAVQSHIHP